VFGWVLGSACGVVLAAAIVRGLARHGAGLGPADLVTLTRATLACGLAALVTDAFLRKPAAATVVTLSIAALVLDAVDGWVARRTRTVSTFGARFDGEVDAFLIAVLSVYVARSFGWWVLALGAARYAFAIAGWGLPWLRKQLPYRYWRKVVTAAAGIVLAVGAADVLPRPLTFVALAAGVVLIAESFGRDVWWLFRHRSSQPADAASSTPTTGIKAEDGPPRHRRVRRPVLAALLNVGALLLVWFALVAPNESYRLSPAAFLRIPVEGLVVAGLALVLPSWARRIVAVVVGVLLGLLTVLKLLDMGFFAAFDRPFDLATDGGYLGSAIDLAKDSIGGRWWWPRQLSSSSWCW
jgi:phosphatidylglycerophosphate synthase